MKPSIFLCKEYVGDGQCYHVHIPCGYGVTIGGWFNADSFRYCPGCGQRIERHIDAEQEREKRRNRISEDQVYEFEKRQYEARQRAPYWILEEVWISKETGEEANRKQVWHSQAATFQTTSPVLWDAIKRVIAYNLDDSNHPRFFNIQYELKRVQPDHLGSMEGFRHKTIIKTIPIQGYRVVA